MSAGSHRHGRMKLVGNATGIFIARQGEKCDKNTHDAWKIKKEKTKKTVSANE